MADDDDDDDDEDADEATFEIAADDEGTLS